MTLDGRVEKNIDNGVSEKKEFESLKERKKTREKERVNGRERDKKELPKW